MLPSCLARAIAPSPMVFPMTMADGHAHVDHSRKLDQGSGYGLGRGNLRGDMAVDHACQRQAQAQQHIAEQHRQAEMHVLLQQRSGGEQKALQSETDPLLPEHKIPEDKEEFKHTGDHSADGGAHQFQSGRAQLAKDKYPVKEQVQNKCHGGADQRDIDLSHAPHQIRGGGAESRQKERQSDQPHIGYACPNHVRIVGKNPEDPVRTADGKDGEHRADQGCNTQRDGCGDTHGLDLLPAPELAGHHHGAGAEAHTDELEEGIYLIPECGSSDRRFSKSPDHQVVHKVDAYGDQLLKDHRRHQDQRAPVKVRRFSYKQRFRFHVRLTSFFQYYITAPEKVQSLPVEAANRLLPPPFLRIPSLLILSNRV